MSRHDIADDSRPSKVASHARSKEPTTIQAQPLKYDQGLHLAAELAAPAEPAEKEAVRAGRPMTISYEQIGKPWRLGSTPRLAASGKRSRLWLAIFFFAIILVVVAVGVGVGIGLGKRGGTSRQSASPSPSPSNVPTTASLPAVQLLADTSIAACENSDGRHVFFQATNGSIQHAVYSSNWVLEDLGLPSARPFSPLSALMAPDGTMYLFYVATDETLTSIHYASGSWQPVSIVPTLQASNETRQLVVNSITSAPGDASRFESIMMTQLQGQGISTIYLSLGSTASFLESSNINRDLFATTPYPFQIPCAAASNVSSAGSQFASFLSSGTIYPWVGVCCSQFKNPTSNLNGASYDGQKFNSSLFDAGNRPATPLAPGDMEIVFINGQLSVLYIDKPGLVSSGGAIPNDTSNYPYTRMATIKSGHLFYMYHQLDIGTIVEAVYDIGKGGWTSSNITTLS